MIFKGLDALFLKGDKSLVESVVVLDRRFSSCDDMPGEFQDDIQKNFVRELYYTAMVSGVPRDVWVARLRHKDRMNACCDI